MEETEDNDQNKAIEDLSFEDALEQLENIVRTLESGRGALEQSIDQYARGAELKKHCEKKLNNARSRIEKIVMDENGIVSSKDMSADG